jgi:hypothetical protein
MPANADSGRVIRLAYADPPYLGQADRYDHPDAARWDDPAAHVALMAELDATYDGWAMSCSAPSLRELVHLSPPRSRVGSWSKPWCAYKRNVRIAYSWEPVIFAPGRDRSADGAPVGRDHLAASMEMRRGLVGAKPIVFCRWILTLLGYVEGDEVTDVFPGTGIMGRVLAQGQLVLSPNGRSEP